MSTPILHINYTEPDHTTYAGAQLDIRPDSITVDTGDPAADYKTVSILAYIISDLLLGLPFVMCSSDVDNFIMDGGDLGENR